MPKVQLDIDKFMEIMKTALIASSVTEDTKQAKPQKVKEVTKPKTVKKVKEVVVKPKSRKVKPVEDYENYANEPEVEEDLPPRRMGDGYTTRSKRDQPLNPDGTRIASKTIPFKKRKSEIKFLDPGTNREDSFSIKDPNKKVHYPQPVERERPKAERVNFRCDACGNTFEGYLSEYPQAQIFRVKGGEEFRPILKCNECSRRGGNVGYVP